MRSGEDFISEILLKRHTHVHQKLTEKEIERDSTKCHHNGGMYKHSPALSTRSQYGASQILGTSRDRRHRPLRSGCSLYAGRSCADTVSRIDPRIESYVLAADHLAE